MKNFKLEYKNLEAKVLRALKERIELNKTPSSYFTETNCLKIDIHSFEELVFMNNKLQLVDAYGYNYSLSNLRLENLIDILNTENKI